MLIYDREHWQSRLILDVMINSIEKNNLTCFKPDIERCNSSSLGKLRLTICFCSRSMREYEIIYFFLNRDYQ
jgi:hypothetical protein